MAAKSLRILVADDHEDSVSPLARLLRQEGHDVHEARSVADAFRFAVSAPVDLLISDLDLTDGDGCELLRRIRQLHPTVRGIAVSGFDGEAYERQCREAGYERLLSKPLIFQHIRAAIGAARPPVGLGGVPSPTPAE
jgi:CheY-like chemotaxis protein